MCDFYAHSREDRPEFEWHRLDDHLRGTAERAARFAADFDSNAWARVAGLWHDLGKYSHEFQNYLRSANDQEAHLEQIRGRVDHSTAGAQHAEHCLGEQKGRILAYAIAGHHGGLPDWDDYESRACLVRRLKKTVPTISSAPIDLLQPPPPPDLPIHLEVDSGDTAAFQIAFFCRMLFSCLVDADFLSTESFIDKVKAQMRKGGQPSLAEMDRVLTEYLNHLEGESPASDVNIRRQGVHAACIEAANEPPGLFSLTVPTGGGKTFSSLAFGLRHAMKHGLDRVICVIPFTSIIEQNADKYREIFRDLGDDVVLEHHSGLDPSRETFWSRLASENWDSQIVVTTNVQFFESLFAARPSRCRKLHNVANSVIILDEVQTLPVELLEPCIAALRELATNYHSTIVLCSATQPAVARRNDFPIGLEKVQEIIPDPHTLYTVLRRTTVTWHGKVPDDVLSSLLSKEERVLCVVNTRRHAVRLFEGLVDDGPAYHLSAAMCPEHRTAVIGNVSERLSRQLPCRVVSTQLIEAGVDLDFPVVYRALAGIDSIAQAAGRCNREGKLPDGKVFVFEPEEPIPPGHLRQTADTARELLGRYEDLLSLDTVQAYFELHYWKRQDLWDHRRIMQLFKSPSNMFFQFRQAQNRFRIIDDSKKPVIVPWGDKGRRLVEQLTGSRPPDRHIARQAQRFIVTVREDRWNRLTDSEAVRIFHDRYPVLQEMSCYCENLGLRADLIGGASPESLVC